MSRSRELLPEIVKASNNTEAVEVLHSILELLHLSESYTNLVKVRDDLAEHKDKFRNITDEYDKSEKDMAVIIETRSKLNFLYRDITDKFSYIVNKNKIFFEEQKTAVRAESMRSLRDNEEIQAIFKTKSTSGLRDIVGMDARYQEYISNAAISYGVYQELNNVLNSIRMFIDLLASHIKNEQLILQKDAK